MREPVAQFNKFDSAVAVNQAVLWNTVPVTVLKTRKRKIKHVATVKQSKGFAKGSGGFANGYPRKTFV